MKLLTTLKFIAVLAVAATAVMCYGMVHQKALAQGQNKSNSSQSQSKNSQNNSVTYNYVAQPGDSYTLMARKAVQTYGAKHKVNITPAGIIFAETNITQAAGSPALDEGQHVSISESTIKGWVDKAKNLSQAEQDAWAVYVPLVNFDTSHVGQSH